MPAPELKLVRSFDQRVSDCIRDLRTNWNSIRQLSLKHELPESVVRELQKRYDPQKNFRNVLKREPKQAVVITEPIAEPKSSRLVQFCIWIGNYANPMTAIGLTLAGVGIVLNYQFVGSLGQTLFASRLLGIVGVAIDSAAVFLPPKAASLWHESRFQSLLAIVVWLVCFAISLVSGLNFAASNIGDSLQGREIIIQHRQALNSELALVQASRALITEVRDPAELEEKIQIARGQVPTKSLYYSKDCTDVTVSGYACAELNQLRASKRAAERRIELETRMRQINEEVSQLPPIAVKSPGAEALSGIVNGVVSANTFEKGWVIGIAVMPSLAGLLLMFARKGHAV